MPERGTIISVFTLLSIIMNGHGIKLTLQLFHFYSHGFKENWLSDLFQVEKKN